MKNIIKNVEILKAVAEGKTLAKIDGKVVFVRYGVPGDIVDIKIIKKKRKYFEAKIENLIKASQWRKKAFCNHFGICGGCMWQNMDYEKQLEYKNMQVIDCFERIAKVKVNNILPIIPCKEGLFYRNKVEFTFSDRGFIQKNKFKKDNKKFLPALGFHIPGKFSKVLHINECLLQNGISNKIRNFIYNEAIKRNYTFFNIVKQKGWLRNLIIRKSALFNDLMIILVFYYDDESKRNEFLNLISKKFPEITSINYIINSKKNDSYNDLTVNLFKGEKFIRDKIKNKIFKISPKTFFQTNTLQAEKLYNVIIDFANFNGNELVYDLYTGAGTIAICIADMVKKVIGIECNKEAIFDANENAAINNIKNVEFLSGDVLNLLKVTNKADIIICDPPRAGMHLKVLNKLKEIQAKKIIYISCNPATQARDINVLADKYFVDKIRAVDMFPHTHHIENVALLIKK